MTNVPVLVLANKQDLMNALPADEVSSPNCLSCTLSSLSAFMWRCWSDSCGCRLCKLDRPRDLLTTAKELTQEIRNSLYPWTLDAC